MTISVIVSYCSLDKRFLTPLIQEIKKFSDNIIFVYYDKLLNGTQEDTAHLEEHLKIFPEIATLQLNFTNEFPPRYYHNLARWRGMEMAKYDNLLFIDGDEIPEGDILKDILDSNYLDQYDAADFQCYWYFRSANNQATTTEHCALFVKKSTVTKDLMFTNAERWSFTNLPGINYGKLICTNQGPFFHHFSWVRTKEEMLTKVSAWGHKFDRDWNKLIEQEFLHPFNGKDFVHGYSYKQVADKFNLGL
jgi:hypothetical protein